MELYVDTGGYPKPEHFKNGYSKSMSRSVKVNEQVYEYWQNELKDFIVCRVNGKNENLTFKLTYTQEEKWNQLEGEGDTEKLETLLAGEGNEQN